MPSSSSGSSSGGSSAGPAGPGPGVAPVQPAHDHAAQPQGVELVGGQEVGQARGAGVHRGPAQLLLVGVLVDGHLHQRRAAQEDPGLVGHEDGVVAHARARRRPPAVDEPNTSVMVGIAGRRQPGQALEGGPAGHEDLGLAGQVGAARLGQVDQRQPVARRRSPGPAGPWPPWSGLEVPPRTVGSLALITHSTPSTRPMPVTRPPPSGSSVPQPARGDSSRNGGAAGRPAGRCARGPAGGPARGGGPRSARRRPRAPGLGGQDLVQQRRAWRRGWPGGPRRADRCWSAPPGSCPHPTAACPGARRSR